MTADRYRCNTVPIQLVMARTVTTKNDTSHMPWNISVITENVREIYAKTTQKPRETYAKK